MCGSLNGLHLNDVLVHFNQEFYNFLFKVFHMTVYFISIDTWKEIDIYPVSIP